MYRRILTPLTAIGVTLIAATSAQAHTATVEVSPRCDATGRITVQINHNGFPTTPSWVADQVNLDGHPARTINGTGQQLNDQGDALYKVSGSSRVGYILQVQPNSGTHTVTVYSKWFADGGGTFGPKDYTVECGTIPPKIIYVDRPGPVQTIEKTNTIYITQPAPPRKAECVAYRKTLNVMVGLKNGHENGPKMTRVDVWVNNVLVRRTGSRKAETKRIPLVLPCGTHKIRVTASIVYRGRHFTKTKRARVTGTGLGVLPVMLARL